MMMPHRATWVPALLALAVLALVGGVAQASIGEPQPGGRTAIRESQTAERAADRTYQLDGDQLAPTGGTVRLYVHVKKNRKGKFVPDYIGAMFAYGHGLNCDEGPYPVTRIFGTQNDFKVNSAGMFNYTLISTAPAGFAGKVSKEGKKAIGTLFYGPADVYDSASDTTYHNCALPNPVKFEASYTKTTFTP